MEKRPWHIEITSDKEPTEVVKKSRAVGISYTPFPSPDKVLAKKKEFNKYAKVVYENYFLGVPYFGKEDRNE